MVPNMPSKKFQTLREWRRYNQKLKQEELAEQIGVSQSTVSSAENGNAASLRHVLLQIQRVYNVDPSEFGGLPEDELDGSDNSPTKQLEALQQRYIAILEENSRLKDKIIELQEALAQLRQ